MRISIPSVLGAAALVAACSDGDGQQPTDGHITDGTIIIEPTFDTGPSECVWDEDLPSVVPQSYSGTTQAMGDDLNSTFCSGGDSRDLELGFTVPDTATYRFTLLATFDAVLVLTQGCETELACVDEVGNEEELTAALTAGDFVVIGVDGHDTTFGGNEQGTFDLDIATVPTTETACDDGEDEDEDGDTDCEDADCVSDPVCAEVCDDQTDDNGNGLIDCIDPVCSGDAACQPMCPDATLVGLGPHASDTTGALDEESPTCGLAGGSDHTVEFTAPAAGDYVFDLSVSSFDTVLSVFDGCGGTEVACNDDWADDWSQVMLNLTAGQTVVVNVDGQGPFESGSYGLQVAPLEANELDCADGRDLDNDGMVDCADADCGTFPICYEDCGDGIDNDVDGFIDCFDTSCASEPTCQPVCPEMVLGVPPETVNTLTTGRLDQHTPTCAYSTASDRSFAFTAPADGDYTFDTIGSNFDTVIYALDGCAGAELDCDDDIPGSLQSEITLTLTMGQQVIIVVDGYDIGDGIVVLNTQ